MTDEEDRGPWLAARKMPDDDQYNVEVYGRSMGTRYDQLVWVSRGSEYLKPWHVWRYHDVPDKSMLDKASRERRKNGAKPLKGNGYYMSAEWHARREEAKA